MMLNKKERYISSLSGGAMMFLAFPFTGSLTPLIFIGLVPLLIIEDSIIKSKLTSSNLFIHSFLCFLIFNIGTSWWLINASLGGAIFAFLFNSLVMSICFHAFHITRKYVGSKEGYLSLPFYWLGFEYLHNHWEFAHPWLSLGNTFSIRTSWVQWYEYTGVSGGTLWVIIANVVCFLAFRSWRSKQNTLGTSMSLGFVILTPLLLSFYTGIQHKSRVEKDKNKQTIKTVIVQPNIDPYNEKFDYSTFQNQNESILKLASKKVSSETELIVAPETAISASFDESKFKSLSVYPMYRDSVLSWKTNLLIGASTLNIFDKKQSKSSRALKDGRFIEYYNSSLLLRPDTATTFIHKSKLVAGVEQIPYSKYISFFEKLAVDNGGIIGSLGKEKKVKIMQTTFGKIAPIVCYESVFSDFVGEQSRLGAQLLCVITNDGWWKDTPGYKQHFSFARLRAIENRKWLVRSANTGKSGVISSNGSIVSETKWWEQDVISVSVPLMNTLTTFAQYGDILGRSSSFLSVFIFIFALSKKIRPNNDRSKKSNTKELNS